MGCGDACPRLATHPLEDWPLGDSAGQDLVMVRRIRDYIRARVEGLIASLAVTRM